MSTQQLGTRSAQYSNPWIDILKGPCTRPLEPLLLQHFTCLHLVEATKEGRCWRYLPVDVLEIVKGSGFIEHEHVRIRTLDSQGTEIWFRLERRQHTGRGLPAAISGLLDRDTPPATRSLTSSTSTSAVVVSPSQSFGSTTRGSSMAADTITRLESGIEDKSRSVKSLDFDSADGTLDFMDVLTAGCMVGAHYPFYNVPQHNCFEFADIVLRLCAFKARCSVAESSDLTSRGAGTFHRILAHRGDRALPDALLSEFLGAINGYEQPIRATVSTEEVSDREARGREEPDAEPYLLGLA